MMYLGWLVVAALLIASCCFVVFVRRVLAYKKQIWSLGLPVMTMVFLVRNQEDIIEGLIRDVYADTCITPIEVVVMDLGSDDQTRMILERLVENFPGFYCLISKDEPETLKRVYDLCHGSTIYFFDLTKSINYGLMSRTIHSILRGSKTCLYRTKVMYKQDFRSTGPI